MEQNSARKILDKIQRMACIAITGALRTYPTMAIEMILDIPPLPLAIEGAAKRTKTRRARTGLGEIVGWREWTSLTKQIPLLELPRDEMQREYSFQKNFVIEIGSKEEWQNRSLTFCTSQHAIEWYTDGSKSEAGTGFGVFGPDTKLSEPMGKYASIFQAEINAIGRCAEVSIQRNYRNKHIVINSDSQAAIKALNSPIITSRLVWECLGHLNELGRTNRVLLRWVPSHSGIEGNEMADQLAKEGAETPFVGPEPFCGIGKHTYQEMLRKEEQVKRATLWRQL